MNYAMLTMRARRRAAAATAAGWNVLTASYVQSFGVTVQSSDISGLTFSQDGSRMYFSGVSGQRVNEYLLSTQWDISTASFVRFFSMEPQIGNAGGPTFSADGTRMYVPDIIGDDVNQYAIGTAWDISTASFVQAFSVAGVMLDPRCVAFRPDGTKMYVVGFGAARADEYTLSAAWDISTATYSHGFVFASQETVATAVGFKPDGTRMYVCGANSDAVHEYSLSTPWGVSTAAHVGTFSVAAQETAPTGLAFKPDGTRMYVAGQFSDAVHEYSLTT